MATQQTPNADPDRLLRSLSTRSRRHLLSLGHATDQEVRDHVDRLGALSLLRSRNMYRKSYLEICDLFGFDPKGDTPERTGTSGADELHVDTDGDLEPGL